MSIAGPELTAAVDAPCGARGGGACHLLGARVLRSVDLRLGLRVLALGAALAVFYSFEWTWLRGWTRTAAAAVLIGLHHTATSLDAGSDLYLVFDGVHLFSVTRACTYVDLILVAAPFCWRFRRSLGANVRRLAALAVAVPVLNLVRVAVALHLYQLGAPWFYVHDLPDYVIHATFLAVTVLLALRSDRIARCVIDSVSPPSDRRRRRRDGK